jgi:hypothetical protein
MKKRPPSGTPASFAVFSMFDETVFDNTVDVLFEYDNLCHFEPATRW